MQFSGTWDLWSVLWLLYPALIWGLTAAISAYVWKRLKESAAHSSSNGTISSVSSPRSKPGSGPVPPSPTAQAPRIPQDERTGTHEW